MNSRETRSVSRPAPDDATQPPEGGSETRTSAAPPAGAPGRGTPPDSLGGYRIEKLLGEGGMGAVYLARDEKLDRAVAIKTMRAEIAAAPGAADRFLREARAAAKVSHDNIIPILHVGEEGGTPFIVMPLLEGEPLDAFLKRQPVPHLSVLLKVGREAAEGLAAAHARGLVHRDIKPANVWVEGDPTATDPAGRFRRVKILDFGLARPAEADAQLTGTGAVVGTPAYMSPEQARGEKVDFRTDLFSLGVMLYRMATGVLPFTGDSAMAVLTSLAVDDPPPPAARNPQLPPALSDLIMRLLAKGRDERPAAAAEVAAALREIGRQLAAAKKAAGAGPPPVVVRALPSAAAPNPFTDLDATEFTTTSAAPAAPKAAEKPVRKSGGAGLWVAAGLASLLAVVAAGAVVIKVVHSDGKETTLKVPDGSTVTVDKNGNPTVKLPAEKAKPAAPSADHKTAEWVLSAGGKVWVREGDAPEKPTPDDARLPIGDLEVLAGGAIEKALVPAGSREAVSRADLPAAFRLVGVSLTGARNNVTDADLARLKGLPDLAWVDCFEVPVSEAGLAHFAGIPNLRWLGLMRTGTTNAGLKHLAGLKELRGLRLGDTAVTNDGLAELALLSKLEVLRLNGTRVTDAGLVHLKGLRNLRVLELCVSPIADTELNNLGQLDQLTVLDLSRTGVSDVQVAPLVALKNLETLWLHGTKVTKEGVGKLAKALPHCRIEWDGDTVEPVGDRAAAEWVLSVGGNLRVKVANGEKKVTAASDLPPGRLIVTSINLDGEGARWAVADLARLADLPQISALSLHASPLTDAGLVHLKRLKSLTQLYLSRTLVSDTGLAELKGLTHLTVLQLDNTRVTGTGFKELAALTDLASLQLGGTGLTDEGLMNIQGFAALADLNIAGTRVTDAGMAHLAGMTRIRNLNISRTAVTDAGLVHLKGMKQLWRLWAEGTAITDAGLEHLAGSDKLSQLHVRDTPVTLGGLEKLQKSLPKCRIFADPPKK